MQWLLKIVSVVAVVFLLGNTTALATIIETDNREECMSEAGDGLFFILSGKCYVDGDGGEVVNRSDIPSFGLCFGRCESDPSCGAPYYDQDANQCMHYREE